jgi:hypothetical protein
MKADDLIAKAQELRGHAQYLEQRASALKQAETLRSQAAQLAAQADQIEGSVADEGDQQQAAVQPSGAAPELAFVNGAWNITPAAARQ